MQNEQNLSKDENRLLANLLRPGVEIEAVIPPDAPPEELWTTLDACVRGLSLLEARMLRLKPIIGRLLLIFEGKPSLYKELGYDSYPDFMNRGVYDKLGLHRTSAYEGRLAAKEWKQLTPDRYAKIGPKKLNILSKFTTGKNTNAEAWLQTAERLKVGELRTLVEERGLVAAGEMVGAVFSLTTNRSRIQIFNEFFNDGRVHSVVGSKDRDRVLEAMVQECYPEWIGKYEEEKKRQREEEYAATEPVNS